MLEIVGGIAITLALGYVALVFGMFAAMTFGGFDEYRPGLGILFTIALGLVLVLWWVLVGTHIMIGFK